jgi:hypothetical protein
LPNYKYQKKHRLASAETEITGNPASGPANVKFSDLQVPEGSRTSHGDSEMSGDLIGEFKGKISGYRVTEILMNGPKVEVSFRQNGKLLGVDASDMATYLSVMTAPDVMYGEGQGVVRSMSGEMACYRATGTAKMMKGSMPVWRGVLYFQSPTPEWGVLNGVAVAYEYVVDASDNSQVSLWEWK